MQLKRKPKGKLNHERKDIYIINARHVCRVGNPPNNRAMGRYAMAGGDTVNYIKGYSKEVQDIVLQAICNADCFGLGRLTGSKDALTYAGFDEIAENEKLLDNIVFKLGEAWDNEK